MNREIVALAMAAATPGITFVDMADTYPQGENARILGEALRSTDPCIVVAVVGRTNAGHVDEAINAVGSI